MAAETEVIAQKCSPSTQITHLASLQPMHKINLLFHSSLQIQ